jgi:alanyl-tRNA synthetase
VLEKETVQFQKTITNGQKLLRELFAHQKKWGMIAGKDIFMLYDTFGFPLELTREIALEEWYKIDEKGFQKEMEAQQQRSRQWSKDMFKQDVDWGKYIEGIPPTKFVWYEKLDLEKMKLLKDFQVNGQRILIFDVTPFYAESWGQGSDRGIVVLDNWEKLQIIEVKKYENVFLHFVK